MCTEGRQRILGAPLRIALLGASAIAPLAIIAPVRERTDVVVVAVGARDPARAAAFAQTHGIGRVARGYRDLLSIPADLVYLGLPPSEHAVWAIEALRAGRGVLCEKPFALDAAEAEAMVGAAAEAGLPLLEAFHYRFHPAFERVRSLLDAGAIGRLVRADIVMTSNSTAEPEGFRWQRALGGGVLLDLGCYAVHALRSLFGSEPEVTGAVADVDGGVDVRFRASLRFAADVEASFDVSMVAREFAQHLRVIGTSGSISMPWFAMPQPGDAIGVESAGRQWREEFTPGTSFEHQLAHVMAVVRGTARALTGGHDAIANMRVLDRLRAQAGLA